MNNKSIIVSDASAFANAEAFFNIKIRKALRVRYIKDSDYNYKH